MLHLAILLLDIGCFVGHQLALAMATDFPSANPTITKWFGVRGVEMAATTLWARNTHRVRLTVGFGQLNSLTVAVLL
jgi:hypothetical protein